MVTLSLCLTPSPTSRTRAPRRAISPRFLLTARAPPSWEDLLILPCGENPGDFALGKAIPMSRQIRLRTEYTSQILSGRGPSPSSRSSKRWSLSASNGREPSSQFGSSDADGIRPLVTSLQTSRFRFTPLPPPPSRLPRPFRPS